LPPTQSGWNYARWPDIYCHQHKVAGIMQDGRIYIVTNTEWLEL